MSSGRVVVTGIGVLSCLGRGVKHVWKRLCASESGIVTLTDPAFDGMPTKLFGRIPFGSQVGELDLYEHFSKGELRTLHMGTCYAMIAANDALTDANWFPEASEDCERTGVAVGACTYDMMHVSEIGSAFHKKGYRGITPHFISKTLLNMPAGHISIRHRFKGPNHCVSTACTTGAHSIGDAYTMIQQGKADVMLCGSADSSCDPLLYGGFARMRALSTKFNDEQTKASRPFDKDRDGFVMAEGAAMLVLEDLNHALDRKAKIYAEMLGYGMSSDSYHITAPSDDGDGAYRCMKAVLVDASLKANDIGYINAHATSTPLGDAAECRAIKRLFESDLKKVSVSSTKGSTGHLLGAAGSIEAAFSILACFHGVIPPTLNCNSLEEEFSNINFVLDKCKPWQHDRRIALTNSFGFGGTNASICFANYDEKL